MSGSRVGVACDPPNADVVLVPKLAVVRQDSSMDAESGITIDESTSDGWRDSRDDTILGEDSFSSTFLHDEEGTPELRIVIASPDLPEPEPPDGAAGCGDGWGGHPKR
ncbi:hypothetical protein THAOC_10831 [Thalassiosira oceanica]|uniref:Uncharacterized protein n=1 Tax=Thalassiosira oceanica TaxID=159749 RepID=K0SNY5_THAOC|nr:hypothetical protein THAOC_10831 [Thalassiosira oceanica]|eukprot:EJK68038.1 hypothetical protein THAOC_10831 [Thalassiosira oceanica]